MATIITNGCFDLLHEGHKRFLVRAKQLGRVRFWSRATWLPEAEWTRDEPYHQRLVAAVNSDESARTLKLAKWGVRYPIDDLQTRMRKLLEFADEVIAFDSESQLHDLIEFCSPCIIVKGPDYAGKSVTGDDIAPVIILDTPETELVRQFKQKMYSGSC